MNPTPIKINPDGLTAKAKNPYANPLNILPEPKSKYWKFAEDNPSYPLTEPGEPGAEVKAVLIERKTIFDYKEGDEIWFIHFGERTKCRVIGYSEGANKVRFGYMPGCGTGSFYESLDRIEANNPTTFWQVVPNKEETPEKPVKELQKIIDNEGKICGDTCSCEAGCKLRTPLQAADVNEVTEQSTLMYRIVYRAFSDNLRHTIFAADNKELTEKIINLSGSLLTIDTNPALSSKGLVDREGVIEIIKSLIKHPRNTKSQSTVGWNNACDAAINKIKEINNAK